MLCNSALLPMRVGRLTTVLMLPSLEVPAVSTTVPTQASNHNIEGHQASRVEASDPQGGTFKLHVSQSLQQHDVRGTCHRTGPAEKETDNPHFPEKHRLQQTGPASMELDHTDPKQPQTHTEQQRRASVTNNLFPHI